MTLDEKIENLRRLRPLDVVPRDDGSWYVSQPWVEVKDGNILRGGYGQGMSYAEAVLDHWSQLAEELPAGRVIVTDARDPQKRRHWRWGGQAWQEIARR